MVYLEEVKKFIVNHSHEKNILAGLGEVLDEKQKLITKKYLIENILGYIDLYLRQ